MKISHDGEWLDAPTIIPACAAGAGVCPKPVVTFGEPHICCAGNVLHKGLHRCKNCGMEFNSASCNNQEANKEWRGVNGEMKTAAKSPLG